MKISTKTIVTVGMFTAVLSVLSILTIPMPTGVPVFAGMTGGPSWLAGYSGGFIWGFIFLTMLCGVGMAQKQIWLRVLLGLAGLAVCHLLGVIQFAIVAATPFPAAFVAVSVPYIVKDVISVVGAYLVAIPIRKALAAGNILEEKTKAAV